MSAMLRAGQYGNRGANLRRVRSFSLSGNSSSAGSESDDAGARLSVASMDDCSPHVRFASVNDDIAPTSLASSVDFTDSNSDGSGSKFEMGSKPSGDVFDASPLKSALKTPREITDQIAPAFNHYDGKNGQAMALKLNDNRRMMRSATTPGGMTATGNDRTLHHSSSRHEIGGVDAQGIYPPSACVFVANLPESQEDRAIEAAITREFSRFGTVFVKIRREARGNILGMPYAFVQYTNDENAKAAMEEGRGILILGRPCRTEMVKANRAFVMYSRRGDQINPTIAREILEPYGQLSKCEMLSVQMQEAMSLPTAVFVEFTRFEPKRDLNYALRRHGDYRIDAFDTKKNTSRGDPHEEFLDKYDLDRRSVFVGNLPLNVTEAEIREFFGHAGEIVGVNIIARPNYSGQVTRAFAFVQFARADVPDHVVKNFNETFFRNNIVRVERKVFKHVGTPRRIKSQAFSIKTSTTPQTPRTDMFGKSPMGSARFSGHREEFPTSATRHGYNNYDMGHSFGPAGYPAPSPVGPANGQPFVGASGIPVTPSTAQFMPNPFGFAGGYWPGMSSMGQDPMTGQTLWSYTPPVNAMGQPMETPTRGRPNDHSYFHGA
ncbi:hypothetical protein B0J18DRAFT_463040 [Chaetomium sp. MPI-SDFR-AT-0129]|nr:hypothetical protein B0J18DRAFT_463040 [Chaetomium sp. MPI-SDFR-AT-0129]